MIRVYGTQQHGYKEDKVLYLWNGRKIKIIDIIRWNVVITKDNFCKFSLPDI